MSQIHSKSCGNDYFFIAFAIFLNLPQNDEYLIRDYTHNFSHSAYKPLFEPFFDSVDLTPTACARKYVKAIDKP